VVRAAALVALAALAAGCSRGGDPADCRSEQEYQASRSAPRLATPPDVARNPSEPMPIPDVPAELDATQVGCLERPPKFFDRPPAANPGNGGALAPPGGGPPPPSR
jgi:hypothetical protein